jgi:hypothetical protein
MKHLKTCENFDKTKLPKYKEFDDELIRLSKRTKELEEIKGIYVFSNLIKYIEGIIGIKLEKVEAILDEELDEYSELNTENLDKLISDWEKNKNDHNWICLRLCFKFDYIEEYKKLLLKFDDLDLSYSDKNENLYLIEAIYENTGYGDHDNMTEFLINNFTPQLDTIIKHTKISKELKTKYKDLFEMYEDSKELGII